jgi:hypothetical protein
MEFLGGFQYIVVALLVCGSFGFVGTMCKASLWNLFSGLRLCGNRSGSGCPVGHCSVALVLLVVCVVVSSLLCFWVAYVVFCSVLSLRCCGSA